MKPTETRTKLNQGRSRRQHEGQAYAGCHADGKEEIETLSVSVDFLASEPFSRLLRAHSEVLVEVKDFFSHQGVLAVIDGAVLALHLEPSG